MIKIESWFPDEIKTAYLNQMLLQLKTKERTIEFLPGSTIDIQTLLTGKRREVFNVSGIKKYMNFCSFEIKKSNYNVNDYLRELNRVFPQDIKIREEHDSSVYILETNYVKLKLINSNQWCIEGNIKPFYEYYLDIIGVKSSLEYSTFNSFLTDAIKIASEIHKKVADIIQYGSISPSMRHCLLASLHIKCCPYCNRQYITNWYDKDNMIHSTADLDHFYPNSKYPLFAFSLFNFVPSCQICNSRMKGSKDRDILYPYEEDMEEFCFLCEPLNCEPNSLVELWLSSNAQRTQSLSDLYKIVLVDESNPDESDSEVKTHIDRIRKSIEVLHLEEIYQTHLVDAINTMLKIRIYYSGDYANCAIKLLTDIGILEDGYNAQNENADFDDTAPKNLPSPNNFSEEEMRDIILGFVFEGQNKLDQPLGKLFNDVLKHELSMKQLYHKKRNR